MEIPYPDILDVQAPTTLPPSGGHGSAHVENFRYGQVENARYLNIVSFGAAHSEVFGNQRIVKEASKAVTLFETLATVTVTDLKIGGKEEHLVTVRKLVGQLTSQRRSDAPENALEHLESKIEGLQINGQDVELNLHDGLFKCKTFSSLVSQMDSYEGFRPPVLNHQGSPLKWKPPEYWKKGDPYPDQLLRTSIFKEPPVVKSPLVAIPGGCRIQVGGWILTLGDLEIRTQSRRLTMLRVYMAPNQKGTIEVGAVEGDGTRG
jgi:hypothetical protein